MQQQDSTVPCDWKHLPAVAVQVGFYTAVAASTLVLQSRFKCRLMKAAKQQSLVGSC